MFFKNPFLIIILFLIIISVGYLFILKFQSFKGEDLEIFPGRTLTAFQSERKKDSLVLIFVGDIMLDRGVEYMVEKYGSGDYRFPFAKIADYLGQADVLFGNLEGPISDTGQKVGSIYSFRASPEAIEGLVFAGFDILSVANNHAFDYGREAMEDTFLRLKGAEINYLGGGFDEREAYSPVIKEVDGTKIAFLAYTNLCSPYWQATNDGSGIACLLESERDPYEVWLEKERMIEEIKKARNQAEIVVVSFHYGQEYHLEPSSFQVSISQTAVEAGADLIIGHHPHVVQPVEEYNSGYIAYSLGNFIFDQGFSEETMKGSLLKVLIADNKIKEVIPLEIKINQFFQPELIENND